MANYKVLAATLYGRSPQPFYEGHVIDGSRLNADHIPDLIAGKAIEEVKEEKPAKSIKE